MLNSHCSSYNTAIKLKNMEKRETHNAGLGKWQKKKKKKPGKCGKWDTNSI